VEVLVEELNQLHSGDFLTSERYGFIDRRRRARQLAAISDPDWKLLDALKKPGQATREDLQVLHKIADALEVPKQDRHGFSNVGEAWARAQTVLRSAGDFFGDLATFLEQGYGGEGSHVETRAFGWVKNKALRLIDASPGIQLQRGPFGLLVSGPIRTKTLLDVIVPGKGRLINALRLKLRSVTTNLFVNRVETFDGIIPLQQFAISARTPGIKGLAGELWDLRFGFLHRRSVTNDMLVRMEIHFTKGNPEEPDFGVLQIEEVAVETLPRPLTIEHEFTFQA
jgi:hypothetical protein